MYEEEGKKGYGFAFGCLQKIMTLCQANEKAHDG